MTDKSLRNKKKTEDSRWTEVVEQIRHWPPDDPEWDNTVVEAFVYEVQAIAESKCKERENAGRLQLESILIHLIGSHKSELEEFDIDESSLTIWHSNNCDITQVPQQVSHLKNLKVNLDQRSSLQSRDVQNFHDRQNKRIELTQLDEQIFELVNKIQAGFTVETEVTQSDLESNTETTSQDKSIPSEGEDTVKVDTKEPSGSHNDNVTDLKDSSTEIMSTHKESGQSNTTQITIDTTLKISDERQETESCQHTEDVHTPTDVIDDTTEHSECKTSVESPEDLPTKSTQEGENVGLDHDQSPDKVTDVDTNKKTDTLDLNTEQKTRHLASQSKQLNVDRDDLAASSLNQERKTQKKTDQISVSWQNLGWDLLIKNDWAGAYWLSKSLKSQGSDVPISPEILAVLQGSRWLDLDNDMFVFDILKIATEYTPEKRNAERLIGLAAALRTSIVAPHTGLIGWLPQIEELDPHIGQVCDAVRNFAIHNYQIKVEDIQGIAGNADLGQSIENTVNSAMEFLTVNKERRIKFHRATKVLRRLISKDGCLFELLNPVQNDSREQIEQVRQGIGELKERKRVVEIVNQYDEAHSRHLKQITGSASNQLVRLVEDAVTIGRRWCSLVEENQKSGHSGDRRVDQVEILHQELRKHLPNAKGEIDQLLASNQNLENAAIGHILLRVFDHVSRTLEIEDRSKSNGISDGWMKYGTSSLEEALGRRLLYVPEVSVDNDGFPDIDQEGSIAEHLSDSKLQNRTLLQAFSLRMGQKDFRFSEVLYETMNEEDRTAIENQRTIGLGEARTELQQSISKVQNSIEQGMVDGILGEDERTELSSEIETGEFEDPVYFVPLLARLSNISKLISEKLNNRMQELRQQLEGYIEDLQTMDPQGLQMDVVQEFFDAAFIRSDTRVLEEGLSRLREFVSGGSEWKNEWFDPPDEVDVFTEFTNESSVIESGLSTQLNENRLTRAVIDSGQSWNGIRYGELPQLRRKEAGKALESWYQLKRLRGKYAENPRYIMNLFGFLGFSASDSKTAVKVVKHDKDRMWYHIGASIQDLARPIPQFGSLANGLYNLLCLWERPGAATIRAALREMSLDTKPVIVFYMGRLSTRQRINLAIHAREQDLALLVLDEVLLVFLTKLEDNRFPSFLRCSLPYAALNPYMPFQAGSVPPEMFYGRHEMVSQLHNEGCCIVFGGRQLGKSALLRKVQRDSHQPDQESYAWVEDIKLIGEMTSGELPTQLWIRLRDGFQHHMLLKKKITTNQPGAIVKHIKQVMDDVPHRRVIVLFDEADYFLSADAKNGFQVVEGLRALMQDTDSRFRVVFAGLHDVQRFKNIANQPLAHFGPNLLMGPLEPRPARELVREPLVTLGYRFDDETTVLKVLSYTNYHPGLIQYFCHELVRRLQTKRPVSGPPFEVCSDDVEAVYRNPKVRQEIRERLDWTLALDPRYQCIAWTMIYEQKDTRDSYIRSFGTNEILQLVRGHWPAGFNEVDIGTLDGLLGEMVGLGILVQGQDGSYLLRSPNLVRLMGTEEAIEYRLLELMDKPPPAQFKPESFHPILDTKNQRYSPLTLGQEGKIQDDIESGVTLLFGSTVLGIGELGRALKRIDGCEPIPSTQLSRGDLVVSWLVSHSRKFRNVDHLRPFGFLRGTRNVIEGCVWKVSKKCEEFQKRGKRSLRVILILDPVTAWNWFKTSRVRANENVQSLRLRRWDEAGIQQRLQQSDMLDSTETYNSVKEITGGWPLLLDHLFSSCGQSRDPRPVIDQLTKEFEKPKPELAKTFLNGVGLTEEETPFKLFKTMVDYGEVSDTESMALSEFIEGTEKPNDEECKNAIDYLFHMGCIDKTNGGFKVEPVLARIVERL